MVRPLGQTELAQSGGMVIASNTVSSIQADLGPVRKTKVYAEVAAQIQRLFAEGRLKPGDKLPPERELAEIFGVSRSSVRDAIRVLEMQGLVEPRHGDGTIVREIPIDRLVRPLADALSAGKDLLADLFDMRKMLEPPLARAAAYRATDDDVRALEQIVERQTQRIRAGELALEDDNEFHYRIAAAAKNQVVLRTMDVLMDLLRDSRTRSLQGPGRAEKSLEGHRRILDAIRRRNPEAAAERMRGHIEEIEGTLFPKSRPAEGPRQGTGSPAERSAVGGAGSRG
jgi:GntR family transcriptional regulator, transcriptional repressor for pyruvate dehydrogenase complex